MTNAVFVDYMFEAYDYLKKKERSWPCKYLTTSTRSFTIKFFCLWFLKMAKNIALPITWRKKKAWQTRRVEGTLEPMGWSQLIFKAEEAIPSHETFSLSVYKLQWNSKKKWVPMQ
jgi:hypothetical protein